MRYANKKSTFFFFFFFCRKVKKVGDIQTNSLLFFFHYSCSYKRAWLKQGTNMLFDVPQSLPLLILVASLSGIFLTLSTASAHIQAHIERLSKKEKENEESDSNPPEDNWKGNVGKKKWMEAVRQHIWSSWIAFMKCK